MERTRRWNLVVRKNKAKVKVAQTAWTSLVFRSHRLQNYSEKVATIRGAGDALTWSCSYYVSSRFLNGWGRVNYANTSLTLIARKTDGEK
jgi:hypothetical protein